MMTSTLLVITPFPVFLFQEGMGERDRGGEEEVGG
jgi:hypothetical protein